MSSATQSEIKFEYVVVENFVQNEHQIKSLNLVKRNGFPYMCLCEISQYSTSIHVIWKRNEFFLTFAQLKKLLDLSNELNDAIKSFNTSEAGTSGIIVNELISSGEAREKRIQLIGQNKICSVRLMEYWLSGKISGWIPTKQYFFLTHDEWKIFLEKSRALMNELDQGGYLHSM